jgi:hypothetical protein
LEQVGVDWRIILKRILKRQNVKMWNVLIWLKIATCGRHLGFHKRRGIFLTRRIIISFSRRTFSTFSIHSNGICASIFTRDKYSENGVLQDFAYFSKQWAIAGGQCLIRIPVSSVAGY